MIFSEASSIQCPEGYIPIQKPKDMNKRVGDGLSPVDIRVTVPLLNITLNDFQAILAKVLIQVNNSSELVPAYTQQLAKIYENNFIVGLSDAAFTRIKSQFLSDFQSRKKDFDVTISTADLFLFQRIKPRFPLS